MKYLAIILLLLSLPGCGLMRYQKTLRIAEEQKQKRLEELHREYEARKKAAEFLDSLYKVRKEKRRQDSLDRDWYLRSLI